MIVSLLALLLSLSSSIATQVDWHFEYSGGVPHKIVWQSELGHSYDLWFSEDLDSWTHVGGFPKEGAGVVMEHSFTSASSGYFKIVVEVPASVGDGFALISAGSFQMGDQSNPKLGDSDELPVHSVDISEFYMGKYEVTKALWDDVRAWGLTKGYTDLPVGGGKAADHPVQTISRYAMLKWCNARSEKEELTPCYRVGTSVYRTGNTAPDCLWDVDGYRLPTEAEWEKAARGGLGGKIFPWGDTISHSNANYKANSSGFSYDISPTQGLHPDWNDWNYPTTSPVGTFAPNGYGLYDMAGNVWENCWDGYDSGYYATSPGTDPRGGSATGGRWVSRGGVWGASAEYCRVAGRHYSFPYSAYNNVGFRTARSLVP